MGEGSGRTRALPFSARKSTRVDVSGFRGPSRQRQDARYASLHCAGCRTRVSVGVSTLHLTPLASPSPLRLSLVRALGAFVVGRLPCSFHCSSLAEAFEQRAAEQNTLCAAGSFRPLPALIAPPRRPFVERALLLLAEGRCSKSTLAPSCHSCPSLIAAHTFIVHIVRHSSLKSV